jgi:hypothetical protein
MSYVLAASGIVPIRGVMPRDPREGVAKRTTASSQANSQENSVKAGQVGDKKAVDKDQGGNQVGPQKLKPAEEKLVQELSQIDQKVRAHEAAHQAAAGGLGGAASYSYQTGPDGKSYAVAGEVPIDMSSGRTPEETVGRAQQVRAAALAPADPSPQDLAVAAQAAQMESSARQEMAQVEQSMLRARSGNESDSQGSNEVQERATATISALESEWAARGSSRAQLQHFARLAAAAYRM